MLMKVTYKTMLFLACAVILSCGVKDEDIHLTGKVSIPEEAGDLTTPRFVAVARSEDFSRIFTDPLNSILEVIQLEENSEDFSIDLSDKGLEDGSGVMILAYTDRDFTNSVPFPQKDDYLGIYVKESSLDMFYQLSKGDNYVEMDLDRRVYDFDAKVTGTIAGNESGDVILAAYTGELTSINFSDLNASNIIAYQVEKKTSAPLSYTLSILPYGHNVPISDVFVCAILDRNKNGVPDAGDLLGFHSANSFGTPTTVTVDEGTLEGIDISFAAEIGESVPEDKPAMSIQGSFTPPAEYTAGTGAVYIFVSKADTGSAVFSNVFDGLQYFERLPAGVSSFDIDLADTSLIPGDAVTVFAIWDKNNTGGFVEPGAGDKVGVYQNKSDFSMAKTLAEGGNTLSLSSGWSFNLDRTIYDHNMGISFKIEAGDLEKYDVQAQPVTVFAVARSGVDDDWSFTIADWPDLLPDYGINDMDKILGMANIVVTDFYRYYTLNFFSFISDSLVKDSLNPTREFDPVAMTMDSIYIFAVLDSNNNGLPDNNERLGYYYKTVWQNVKYVYYPQFYGIPAYPLLNEITELDDKAVRFSSEEY
jgi:hypothetical protein